MMKIATERSCLNIEHSAFSIQALVLAVANLQSTPPLGDGDGFVNFADLFIVRPYFSGHRAQAA